jgi:hypothetical protein
MAANPGARPTDFCRRIAATEGMLTIEDDVINRRTVDPSGLTRIEPALSCVALRSRPRDYPDSPAAGPLMAVRSMSGGIPEAIIVAGGSR